jgi:hypothetical protein
MTSTPVGLVTLNPGGQVEQPLLLLLLLLLLFGGVLGDITEGTACHKRQDRIVRGGGHKW